MPADTTKPLNNSSELSIWTRTIPSPTGFSVCCSGKQVAYELAITEGEKGVKLSGGSPLMRAALAHTLGTAGRTKEALEMLDDLTKLAKQKYVAPYFFAGIHIGLGENERAIEYLEKCYEEHSHWLIYLHIDPSMDGLRDNQGFQSLLRRVGLPALTTATPI